jgi:hypothetical protein
MVPPTLNRLEPLVVISCLQKAIRRADERLAMQCAVELAESSKTYGSMLLNRLRIILHEDLDVVARPDIIAGVEATIQQIETIRADPKKKSKVRMLLGTIIRIMARAPKSREGDHFHVAVGWPVVNGTPPVIPEWAYDKHTSQGRRQGRGLDHFRESSCQLVPPPAGKDAYEDEAYAIWEADERGGRTDLFDDE